MKVIRLRQIKVRVSNKAMDEVMDIVARRLGIKVSDIVSFKVVKRSIDARRKPDLYYSYIVDVLVDNENSVFNKVRSSNDILMVSDEEYKFEAKGSKKLENRPVVVGSGPCGLICGYMLALYGYKPIIIERGKNVLERDKDVNLFWKTGKLDNNSNIQFGEGGAGTFSDGKLNTLIKDKNNYHKKVFSIFVENGAPSEILYENKPHIGTDLLKRVVSSIRNKIIELGGEVRFNTCLTDINISNNKLEAVVLNNKEVLPCDVLVLAIGHSARDTIRMLYKKKIEMKAKPFAVGIRIQHKQEMINLSQYGVKYHKLLKAASYKLTARSSDGRGVYTFCMCPGGYVINASSEQGGLCVNGMSNYNRDSGNANSAVIVTVSLDDYGTSPMDGIEFQRKIEHKAYELGRGKIPVSLFGDYKNNRISSMFGSVKPVFKGNYEFCNVNDMFPDYINNALKEGIISFDKKIKGFASDDAIIAGPEARTSSPVRIMRDDNGEASVLGIYPSGEGAGYAGGITSAAIDGLVTFERIASVYKNFS